VYLNSELNGTRPASYISKRIPEFRTEMSGLSDSLTVAILLTIVFGAVTFYLYSRMGQTEKRLGLLENLLLTLKMSTEASLMGPDSVEPVSSPQPLNSEDVDDVDEEKYAEVLKNAVGVEEVTAAVSPRADADAADAADAEEEDAEELLRSIEVTPAPKKMDVNYESMSLKELKSLAKERGVSSVPTTKREVIDVLKKAVNVDLEETFI